MALFAFVPTALAAPLVRDLRPGTERKYRVTVESEAGEEYAYRLRLKIVGPRKPKLPVAGLTLSAGASSTPIVDILLTDYHGTMQGEKISLKTMGGGQMPLDPSGLPQGLDLAGPQGPVFLPLFSLVIPGGEEGPFDLAPVDLGSGLSVHGKGSFERKDRKSRVEIEATIARSGKDLGKLTVSTEIDGGGWPAKSEGTLVSADGTYRFKLKRA